MVIKNIIILPMYNPLRFPNLIGGYSKSLKRLALWVLIFVFIASTIAPGLALAVVSPSESLGVTMAATTEAPPAGDQSISPPNTEENSAAMLAAGSGGTTEFNFLRDPVKSRLNVNTDAATGAFTYAYPLAIPPGRNGLQPSLSLNYHSQDLENDNLFGYGWSASIPYIERIPRKGVDKLYDGTEEYFYSSLSGELEKITQGGMALSQSSSGEESFSPAETAPPDTEGALNPDGSFTLAKPQEQARERTVSSKTDLVGYTASGASILRHRAYIEPIHYRNPATGAWDDIDARLVDQGNDWVMDKDAYRARIPKQGKAPSFVFINQSEELTFTTVSGPGKDRKST